MSGFGWKRLETAMTWLMRIVVGLTFTFSGFVKGIDPWGTLYKFEDYMGALGLPVYDNLLLVGVFGLCIYEFCVGVFLLTGCFRRSTPIAAALMMAVMLPLTLWIAVKDPVADCGCFGDAFVISNWATFWKNVVLSAAIVWLIRFNSKCRCLIRPFIQWLALLGSIAFLLIVGLIGYVYQPLIDFRPYPVGSELLEDNLGGDDGVADIPTDSDAHHAADSSSEISDADSDSQSDSYSSEDDEEYADMRFVYAKDGVEKSFSIDDELPDESDGWVFVRREDNLMDTDEKTAVNLSDVEPFRIWSEDGNSEVTREAISSHGGELLLLMPDLKNVSPATTWQINSLYVWSRDNDIKMIGVVSATPEEIANWKDISLAAYPLYTAEDTQIKMLARGNPAVVYIKNGRILWKSSLRALDTDDFQASGAIRNPEDFGRDDHSILRNITGFYVLYMAVLILLSLLPLLGRFFPSKVRTSIEERDAKISEKEVRMEAKMEARLEGRKESRSKDSY